jgi:hypothetical protein
MKKIIFVLLNWCICISIQAQQKQFDIFSFTPPANYQLKEQQQRIVYERTEGNTFCQIHLWPVQQGTADPQANFKTDWDHFAGNPYKTGDPKEKQTLKLGDWDVVTGVAVATVEGMPFIISVSTFTQNNLSWCIITQFNDEKYTTDVDAFVGSIITDVKKFKGINSPQQQPANPPTPSQNDNSTTSNSGITKSTTTFDDGWTATITNDYVKVTKKGTELRLHYIDKALDDARPNTVDAPEYYWSKYVAPYFNVPSPEKWSGVQYPVIYHMQGDATDRSTGKSCFIAIKIVYNGGARPIVVIAPNQNSYQQQFLHPNDIDPMLNSNRFAVTAKDIIGTWKGSGGVGVEYYSVYSGTYTGMSAVSSTDEFIFNKDGSYSSMYRSASMNNGGAQFGGQDFKGKFSVTDWSITATNRYKGKTTKYNAQLIAVKNGFLLYMSDPENSSMNYTLFKTN